MGPPEAVQLGQSGTGMYVYDVFLGRKVVICSMDEDAVWEEKKWLEANCEVVWTAYKKGEVIRKFGPWMDFWMPKGIRKILVKKTWTKYVVDRDWFRVPAGTEGPTAQCIRRPRLKGNRLDTTSMSLRKP